MLQLSISWGSPSEHVCSYLLQLYGQRQETLYSKHVSCTRMVCTCTILIFWCVLNRTLKYNSQPVQIPHQFSDWSLWLCLVRARPPTVSLADGRWRAVKVERRCSWDGGRRVALPTVHRTPKRSNTPRRSSSCSQREGEKLDYLMGTWVFV